MNKAQQIQAAYFVCLAWGKEPSVRNINEMVRRITTNGHPGKGFRGEDIRLWLKDRDTVGIQTEYSPDTPVEHENGASGYSADTAGKPSCAPHKVLDSEANTETNVSVQPDAPPKKRGGKVPKQPGLDLGDSTVPEIDHDRAKHAFRDDLPEHLPDDTVELKRVACVFVEVFVGSRKPEKLKRYGPQYTNVLARLRRDGISTRVAWQAFLDAKSANEFKPLCAPSTCVYGYLPGRKQPAPGPRVDSCGCPLPPGVYMPRLGPSETAHYAGDGDWIYGSTFDPKNAVRA